jgi:hypothetical protein
MHILQLIAADTASSAGVGLAGFIGGIIGYVVGLLPLYGVLAKAGEPGWAAFVPIYNLVVVLKIVGRPIWWIILFLIPIANLVVGILVMIDLASSFAKSTLFAIGLIFLGWFFLLYLWLSPARYVGPANAPTSPAPSY